MEAVIFLGIGTDITKAYKAEDMLDKFRDYLLHQTALTVKEQERLDKYRKCFALRCKLFSPQLCVQADADAGVAIKYSPHG